MIAKLALLAVPVTLLAACAPPPSPPPAPAPPPPAVVAVPAAAPEPTVATAPIPIRSLACGDMLGANDDDRAAAAMFFIGYQSALAHVRNLSIPQIQSIEETALAACAANPTTRTVRAFAQAVRAHK